MDGRTLGAVIVAAALALGAATAPARAPHARAGDPTRADEIRGDATTTTRELDVSGCAAVDAEGTCFVGADARVRVWVPLAADEARIEADGAEIAPLRAAPARDGTRFEVRLPPAARTIGVRAATRAGDRIAWTTYASRAIARAAEEPRAVAEARALRDAGKLEAAEAILAPIVAAAPSGGASDAVALLARVAMARGDAARADALLARAMESHAREGRASDAAMDAFALIFARVGAARFAEARPLVDRAAALSRRWPDGRARTAYYAAVLASATGDRRAALRGFRDAAADAARLGVARLERMARQAAALQLDAIGRSADALAEVRALHAEGAADVTPCDRADLDANVGWLALHAGGEDPRPWLARAIDALRTACASYDASRLASDLGNMARAELDAGALDAADARLREAERAAPHPPAALRFEWAATRGDLALARGDAAGALVTFERMRDEADGVGDREASIVALEGCAEARARTHDVAGALRAMARAADLVEASSTVVPLGEGRERFVRARERSDVRRIELLLALDRPREALSALRRARARVLDGVGDLDRLGALAEGARARWDDAVGAYLRERDAADRELVDDWRFARDALARRRAARARRIEAAQAAFDEARARAIRPRDAAPPLDAPGELTLALFAGSSRAYAIGAYDGAVRAIAIDRLGPRASAAELAARLLAPFDRELAAARRVAVLEYGATRAIDVHALPWRGAPLGASIPVVYPLDRVARAAPFALDAASRRALVVGDPGFDLRGARAELDDVAARLRARAWDVTRLRGDDAAADAVRAALPGADLLHYAGHGRFGGRDGWASALPLADHGELSIADVLALPRAPRVVLLLGCDTAREAGEASAEGLGVAQAFLLSGARVVVASTRAIDDRATADFARDLYDGLATDGDVERAMRAAYAAAWRRGAGDAAALRVWLP